MEITKEYIEKCRERAMRLREEAGEDSIPYKLGFGDFILVCKRWHDELYLILKCEFVFGRQAYDIKAIKPDDINARHFFTVKHCNLIPIPFEEGK